MICDQRLARLPGPTLLLAALALAPRPVAAAAARVDATDERTDLRRSAVVRAVEQAGPAVVNIYTEEEVRRVDWSGDFFRDVFEPRYKKSMEVTSLGSGVIIDAAGHVLTNFHVIRRGAKIMVALVDRREFEAKVVGTDPELDLAVLKLETDQKLPFVPMADSSDLLIGETVIAIGNPFGLSSSVTTGVVSAAHRNIRTPERVYHDFLQTDAAINPGNSGGPLLNIDGALIGINTAMAGHAQGIGFAIPVNRARRIVEDLIAYGKVHQAYLGIDLANLSEKALAATGLPSKGAVEVVAVEEGGPAAQGGMKVGDIILSVEGFPIESTDDYSGKLRDYTAGTTVKMKVLRRGAEVEVAIKAGEVPLTLADRIVDGQLGLKVSPIDTRMMRQYNLKGTRGVMISFVRGGTKAAKLRLRPGDVILRVNAVDIVNLEDFRQAILRARRHQGQLEMLIQRGQRVAEVTFDL